jgi:hypothetical protein
VKPKSDLTGRTFGRWTVLHATEKALNYDQYWMCACACGAHQNVSGSMLRQGRSTQCRKCAVANRSTRTPDLTGRVFSLWTVVGKGESDSQARPRWLCRCACGELVNVYAQNLINGASRSCRRCAQLGRWLKGSLDVPRETTTEGEA